MSMVEQAPIDRFASNPPQRYQHAERRDSLSR
jgi:hypothetical protein